MQKDLSHHFDNRVATVINDHMSTTAIVNIKKVDAISMAFSTLVSHAAVICKRCGGSKKDFIAACGEIYSNLYKTGGKHASRVRTHRR
jgi:hypothetical protein